MFSAPARRAVRTALAACVLLILGLTSAPAVADPIGDSPTAKLEHLADLSRRSEQANEALHQAGIDLDARIAEQHELDARAAADHDTLAAAQVEVARFKPTVDKLAQANYRGSRTNRLFAVMVSDSPQQLLDQMVMLDVLGAQTDREIEGFRRATDAAAAAASASRKSAEAARVAAEQAQALRDDLQRQETELESQIAAVLDAFDNLSDEEKSILAGTPFPPGLDADRIMEHLIPGNGAGALRAALTRIGDPYVWGATGPDQFDCSGLVVWAYQQVGKTVPRSSQAQAQGGTPVSRDNLQPGDVIIFYNDASHVGIYAGDGNIVHASTFGVPVKVQAMDSFPFHSARRY
ncbi:C40 family peptidase [Rhodococcus artemisiae]|uniref:C40 family peptidase n=1 Tax=Rhodococcus artemisiae TaxID=714159 RepID=A0ABU7LEZ4_9NOCA|nr:C40 family peptidase [Rhodococcus artemisiae]MEE2059827.1 C40 family peptidase [Rhodococcus artemisiae]